MTAYPEASIERLGLDLTHEWALFKPFTLGELERRVRQALES
jgi:hypothetical protein